MKESAKTIVSLIVLIRLNGAAKGSKTMKKVELQAHRGVESEYPQNTMASFRAAAEQGYERIELDPRVTKDGQFVVLHDRRINSTARNPDGSRIGKELLISELTYAEALEYDFGMWFSPEFCGEKLPLFRDVLDFAAEKDISLKIDNKMFEMKPEERYAFYGLIHASGAHVVISCITEAHADEVNVRLPEAEVSFDGLYDADTLKRLNAVFGRERLTVWIPIDRRMAEWAPIDWFASPEKAAAILPYAKLGIWAIADVESFHRACRLYHPDAAETSGNVKPSDAEKS